jgi:DNA-binding Lrp family transcriptional regulator
VGDQDPTQEPRQGEARRNWTFLSNHAHVLVVLVNDPDVRLRDLASKVGITERAASAIVADLEAAGYLTRIKVGRNNRYVVHGELRLRHPLEAHRTIGEVLQLLGP